MKRLYLHNITNSRSEIHQHEYYVVKQTSQIRKQKKGFIIKILLFSHFDDITITPKCSRYSSVIVKRILVTLFSGLDQVQGLELEGTVCLYSELW